MRCLAFLVSILGLSGAANASSLAVITPQTKPVSTSMIYVGEPDPAVAPAAPDKRSVKSDNSGNEKRVVSASVIAMGEPEPDVADEKVSAIPKPTQKSAAAAPLPTVMRGGLIGDALEPAPVSKPAGQASTTEPVLAKAPAGKDTPQNSMTADPAQPPTASGSPHLPKQFPR